MASWSLALALASGLSTARVRSAQSVAYLLYVMPAARQSAQGRGGGEGQTRETRLGARGERRGGGGGVGGKELALQGPPLSARSPLAGLSRGRSRRPQGGPPVSASDVPGRRSDVCIQSEGNRVRSRAGSCPRGRLDGTPAAGPASSAIAGDGLGVIRTGGGSSARRHGDRCDGTRSETTQTGGRQAQRLPDRPLTSWPEAGDGAQACARGRPGGDSRPARGGNPARSVGGREQGEQARGGGREESEAPGVWEDGRGGGRELEREARVGGRPRWVPSDPRPTPSASAAGVADARGPRWRSGALGSPGGPDAASPPGRLPRRTAARFDTTAPSGSHRSPLTTPRGRVGAQIRLAPTDCRAPRLLCTDSSGHFAGPRAARPSRPPNSCPSPSRASASATRDCSSARLVGGFESPRTLPATPPRARLE